MRYVIAILLLCSTVSAEDIFKPTGRYAVQQWYLVSEPWCAACPAAKTKFVAKGWSRANIISIAEAKSRFGMIVDRVPFEFPEPAEPKPTGVIQSQVKIVEQSRIYQRLIPQRRGWLRRR